MKNFYLRVIYAIRKENDKFLLSVVHCKHHLHITKYIKNFCSKFCTSDPCLNHWQLFHNTHENYQCDVSIILPVFSLLNVLYKCYKYSNILYEWILSRHQLFATRRVVAVWQRCWHHMHAHTIIQVSGMTSRAWKVSWQCSSPSTLMTD